MKHSGENLKNLISIEWIDNDSLPIGKIWCFLPIILSEKRHFSEEEATTLIIHSLNHLLLLEMSKVECYLNYFHFFVFF